jgi:Cu(I)/Ag(I) efflux system membrane fusion protein
VDTGDGSFEPREVKVGVRGNGKAQILSGVKAGENVAVGANFLLDSESKLRAALTKMTGGASVPSQPQPQPQGQPQSQTKPQSQGQGGHAGHGGGQ